MIFGELNELKLYKGISKKLDMAIESIENGSYKNSELGKTSLNGDDVFFTVAEMQTKKEEESRYEIHKKYLDIHVLIDGKEVIGYTEKSNVTTADDYNQETDLQFVDGKIEHKFLMTPNNFIIFFPEELHMPIMAKDDKVSKIKKVIFKVKI